MAAYLDAQGIGDYMAAVAGAIRVKGRNAEGEPWAIAVEAPTPGRREVHRVVRVTDRGLSTSGDYRNFFEQAGRRYSHEIDPESGRPVAHRLASVTVVGESAMRADALATALLVMGEEEGPRLAAAEGLAALFILRTDEGFRETSTPAFRGILGP
jgi:thiamine biosynthesis lipoprotein